MDNYKLNTQLIKKYHTFLYEDLNFFFESKKVKFLDNVYSIEAKNQEIALFIKHKSNETRLNSIYNPTYEAIRWTKQFDFKNLNTVIMMFGLGNGVFARALLREMKPEDNLLIYEPSYEIFNYVLKNYDLTDILEDRRVSLGVDNISTFEFHCNLYSVLDITNMNASIICKHPFMDKIFEDAYVNFWKEIKQAFIHARTNINTIIRFGETEIENISSNLKYLKDSYTIWELRQHIPDEAVAIIVSAGPSVASQIDELKKAKGKAIIIAVDRVLDYLLDSGVIPDFVATVDPIKEIQYFTSRDYITIPLLCFLDSSSKVMNKHKGKKIIINCGEYLIRAYTKLNKMPPIISSSPSVATVAFATCLELGFKRIVLVGQDLAYSDVFTHVGGVKEQATNQMDVFVKGVDGEQIRSRTDWKNFIVWLQDMIILNPNVEVIDSKLKGAKIIGTKNKLLGDVISDLKNEIWSDSRIEELSKTFNDNEYKILKGYLEESKDSLDRIKKSAQNGIEICEKLIESLTLNTTQTNKSLQLELKEINDYIIEAPIYLLMEYVIQGRIADQLVTLKHFSGNVQDDENNTYIKAMGIYHAILDAIDFMKPLLKKGIDELT